MGFLFFDFLQKWGRVFVMAFIFIRFTYKFYIYYLRVCLSSSPFSTSNSIYVHTTKLGCMCVYARLWIHTMEHARNTTHIRLNEVYLCIIEHIASTVVCKWLYEQLDLIVEKSVCEASWCRWLAIACFVVFNAGNRHTNALSRL